MFGFIEQSAYTTKRKGTKNDVIQPSVKFDCIFPIHWPLYLRHLPMAIMDNGKKTKQSKTPSSFVFRFSYRTFYNSFLLGFVFC